MVKYYPEYVWKENISRPKIYFPHENRLSRRIVMSLYSTVRND